MQTRTYKYSFWDILRRYTPAAQAALRRKLASKWGVSGARVTQVINLLEEDTSGGISTDQLLTAAKVLNCDIQSLITNCELIDIPEPLELIDEVQVM